MGKPTEQHTMQEMVEMIGAPGFMALASSVMLLTCASTFRILMSDMNDETMTKEEKFDFLASFLRKMCIESPATSRQLLAASLEMDDLPDVIDLTDLI